MKCWRFNDIQGMVTKCCGTTNNCRIFHESDAKVNSPRSLEQRRIRVYRFAVVIRSVRFVYRVDDWNLAYPRQIARCEGFLQAWSEKWHRRGGPVSFIAASFAAEVHFAGAVDLWAVVTTRRMVREGIRVGIFVIIKRVVFQDYSPVFPLGRRKVVQTVS